MGSKKIPIIASNKPIPQLSSRPFWSGIKKSSVFTGLMAVIILGLVIVSSTFLAKGNLKPFLFLFGLLAIYVILSLLRYPYVSFIVLIGSSLFVPFGIGTGSESEFNISLIMVLLIAGLMFFDIFVNRSHLRFRFPRVYLAILGLIISSVISLGFGQFRYFATSPAPIRAQIGAVALYVFSGLIFIEMGYQIRKLEWLKWVTWTFLFFGAFVIIFRHFPFLNKFNIDSAQGSLFWIWIIAITFSQVLINKELSFFWRIVLVFLAILIFYSGFFEARDWISGWLPGLISILVILWLFAKKLRIPIIFAFIIIAFFYTQFVSQVFMSGDNPYSLMTRLQAWKILEAIIKVNPLFGVGPANYYWYTPLFQILGYSVKFNSHNNYVDIIAQIGFVGLAAFIWVAWEIGRLGFQLRATAQTGFEKAYVFGAIGGLVGTLASGMLGDWVIPFVYNVGFSGFRASLFAWLFLGGLVALERIERERNTQI